MPKQFSLAAVCLLTAVAVGTAPVGWADPPPPGLVDNPGPISGVDDAAPVSPEGGTDPLSDNGSVASATPAISQLPDGRILTVAAENETQLPIPPLTTALSSRDWLVGGTFTGTASGAISGGTLDVGYQIGCRLDLEKVSLEGDLGIGAGNLSYSPTASSPVDLGAVSLPIAGQIEVAPTPGAVTIVSVDKKTFTGTTAHVGLHDIHIKVDGCIGASYLRSYAVFTSLGSQSADTVAYYGITKVF